METVPVMSEPASGAEKGPAQPAGRGHMGLMELAGRMSQALSSAERRALALRLLEVEAEEITFRRDGIRWTAFPWDHRISGPLFVSGGFQAREVRAVLARMTREGRLAAPRDAIIDVGANIGTSTVPFARETGCRVLAIEPVPDVFEVLRRNVADNGLEPQVTCVQAAISTDGRDRVRMALPAGNSGGGEVERPGRPPTFAWRDPVRSTVDVPASGLAELLDAHGIAAERVAFVWSDTQGCEAEVMESGARLGRRRPALRGARPGDLGPARPRRSPVSRHGALRRVRLRRGPDRRPHGRAPSHCRAERRLSGARSRRRRRPAAARSPPARTGGPAGFVTVTGLPPPLVDFVGL